MATKRKLRAEIERLHKERECSDKFNESMLKGLSDYVEYVTESLREHVRKLAAAEKENADLKEMNAQRCDDCMARMMKISEQAKRMDDMCDYIIRLAEKKQNEE